MKAGELLDRHGCYTPEAAYDVARIAKPVIDTYVEQKRLTCGSRLGALMYSLRRDEERLQKRIRIAELVGEHFALTIAQLEDKHDGRPPDYMVDFEFRLANIERDARLAKL